MRIENFEGYALVWVGCEMENDTMLVCFFLHGPLNFSREGVRKHRLIT